MNYISYDRVAGFFNADHKWIYDIAIDRFPNGTFLEIGVLFGRSLIYLAQRSDAKIYGIDLFLSSIPQLGGKIRQNKKWLDKLNGDLSTAALIDEKGNIDQYGQVLSNLEAAGVSGKVKLYKGDSSSLAHKFEDKSLDFVYIDGDHSLSGVKKDISAFVPKVKKGGIIAGDDFLSEKYPGVQGAVKTFGMEYQLRGNSYLIEV